MMDDGDYLLETEIPPDIPQALVRFHLGPIPGERTIRECIDHVDPSITYTPTVVKYFDGELCHVYRQAGDTDYIYSRTDDAEE